MGDPETAPDSATLPPPVDPEPAIPGAPIGQRKPETIVEPITDPDRPELQDRRRPLP